VTAVTFQTILSKSVLQTAHCDQDNSKTLASCHRTSHCTRASILSRLANSCLLQRLDKLFRTEELDYALHVVGKHVQTHLRAHTPDSPLCSLGHACQIEMDLLYSGRLASFGANSRSNFVSADV
jgi:hypothetical protein